MRGGSFGGDRHLEALQAVRQPQADRLEERLLPRPDVEEHFLASIGGKGAKGTGLARREEASGHVEMRRISPHALDINAELTAAGKREQDQAVRVRDVEMQAVRRGRQHGLALRPGSESH